MKLNMLLSFVLLAHISCTPPASQNESDPAADSTPAEMDDNRLPVGDNSRVSVDWPGTYSGILPCNDCPGIYITLELRQDESYISTIKQLGKAGAAISEQGSFSWDPDGGYITLSESGAHYTVGENVLIRRDEEGNPITGESANRFRLSRMGGRLINQYWKLIEVRGQAVPDSRLPEPYILLVGDSSRAFGYTGCNSFNGEYETDGLRVTFSRMISTMRACPDIDFERPFLQALENADNYSLNRTGDTLSLNKARMAPLVRFAATSPE